MASTAASQQEGSGSNSGWSIAVWSLHGLPVSAWVLWLIRLPPTVHKHACVRLIGNSNLAVGV